MHVKKGDKVIVITGKDKGKTGAVVKSMPKENMVLVEGVNIKKVHQHKKGSTKGGVIEKIHPIHASNVKKAGK